MKKLKLLSAFLLLTIPFTVNAQKLPGKQEVSLWAPANVKIDGKATEWDNKLQAFNKATGVSYTVANDDKNLYVVIQAATPVIIRKIIAHGITFTADYSSEKNTKQQLFITYPQIRPNERGTIIGNFPLKKQPGNVAVSFKNPDSLMAVLNKELYNKGIEIKITGTKIGDDTVTSIYNEIGIKAAAQFDHKLALTYELAIPLKYMEIAANDLPLISYNVKLNGTAYADNVSISLTPDGGATIRDAGTGMRVILTNTPESLTYDFPTDFSGKYTLARK